MRIRLSQAITVLVAVALLGMARPAAVSAAIMIDQMSTENATSVSMPALAQTVTAGAGGYMSSVKILLHRTATDTADFRVEIRKLDGTAPSGYNRQSTGMLLAAATVSPAGISTNAAAPTPLAVPFTSGAILAAGDKFAIVLLRGTDATLAWHASAPDSNPYAGGTGWFCATTACWLDKAAGKSHDFVFETTMQGPLMGEKPLVNVLAPSSPTKATILNYAVKFSMDVTGLTADDFTTSGTATGCVIGIPVGAGASWSFQVSGCSQGTLLVSLKADSVDAAGPVKGPAAASPSPTTLRIDRTRPVAYAPRTVLAKGLMLSGGDLPDKLKWTAGTDSGGAGIDLYKIEYSTDAGESWVTLATTKLLTLYSTAEATGILRYRIRAYDHAGNASTWKYGPTLRPRLAQETSTKVKFGGGWTTVTGPVYSGGAAKTSTARGAWARYTFTGRSIAVVMPRDVNLGKVKIYVNGIYITTVDTKAAARSDQVLVWQRTWSTSTTRVVKVVVSGTTGRPRVILDAFARL